jgi:hypothetical protein
MILPQLTAVWRQWGKTNKPLASCIAQQKFQHDVQHSALALIFIIGNSNRLLYRLDEQKCPTERQADER